jgi:hypothetical protein
VPCTVGSSTINCDKGEEERSGKRSDGYMITKAQAGRGGRSDKTSGRLSQRKVW